VFVMDLFHLQLFSLPSNYFRQWLHFLQAVHIIQSLQRFDLSCDGSRPNFDA